MPALHAVISGNADPLKRELAAVQRLTQQAGNNLKNMGNGAHGGGNSGALRETLVLMREISRGNFTRVPGSLSILLGQLNVLKFVFKDAAGEAKALAAALAAKAAKSAAASVAAKQLADASVAGYAAMRISGEGTILAVAADKEKAASALRVAEADRIKAVAARESAAAMEAEGAASRFALTPVGWLAAGVIALGTAAYFLVSHLAKVREEEKALADLMDTASAKFSSQADAFKDAAEEAENFAEWLKKIASGEDDVADATDKQLESLRERLALQKQLAQAQGATPQDLAKMDIAGTQKELDVVTLAKLHLRRKVEQDQDAAQSADDALKSDTANNGGKRKDIGGKVETAKAIMDEIQGQMKTAKVRGEVIGTGFEGAPLYGPDRAANAKDKLPVKGKPEMSLDEATANYQQLRAQQHDLDSTHSQLVKNLADAKKLTESDSKKLTSTTGQATTLEDRLANQKEYLPQIADAEDAKQDAKAGRSGRMTHGSVNSLQQIGAYAGAASMVGRSQDTGRTVSQISSKIDRMTAAIERLSAHAEKTADNTRPSLNGVRY